MLPIRFDSAAGVITPICNIPYVRTKTSAKLEATSVTFHFFDPLGHHPMMAVTPV